MCKVACTPKDKRRHPSKLWQNLRLFMQEVKVKAQCELHVGVLKAYLKTFSEHFKAGRVTVSGYLMNFLSNL